MADVRSSVCVLEDVSTQAGLPWHKVAAGDAAASKNAGAVLGVKDESGNLQYIPLIDGKIPVTFDASDIAHLYDQGNHAGSATYVTLATITLQNSKDYRQLEWVASSFRDSVFQVIWNDDTTPTTLLTIRVSSHGEVTTDGEFEHLDFTSGASGTQTLIIQGKNSNALSDMDATIAIEENQ